VIFLVAAGRGAFFEQTAQLTVAQTIRVVSTGWQPEQLVKSDYAPAFNNLQQQQSSQFAVGVQQSDVISVNLRARSSKYLHTQLRWFESHDVCLVQHLYTHKACYQCVWQAFTARMQGPVWDSRQHVTMEDVAVLIFSTTCEDCSLSGGRRTYYVVTK
jgi:hypothetical protein